MSRIIRLEGTFNTRDIGGIVNKEGKVIVARKIIRSDALNSLTNNDIDCLKKIGLKTIVDFRGEKEVEKAPDVEIPGVNVIQLSPNAEIASVASGNIVDDKKKIDLLLEEASTAEGRAKLKSRHNDMAQQMRELVKDPYANKQYTHFLNLISEEENLPLLHHCKGGKDRTGFASMITLFALDVDIEEVEKDYMLTKECMSKRNERRMDEYRAYTTNEVVLEYLSTLMQTKKSYFDAAIDEMLKLSGSVDNYLKEFLGLTIAKKNKIKKIFLES